MILHTFCPFSFFVFWLVGKDTIYYFSGLLTGFIARHALLGSHFSLLVQRKVTKRKHINDPTFNRGEKKGVPHASKAPSNSPPHSIRYLTTHWLFGTDYFYMMPLSASLSSGRSLFCSKQKNLLGFRITRCRQITQG